MSEMTLPNQMYCSALASSVQISSMYILPFRSDCFVQQNINRLIKYGIPVDRVGAYFGERKKKLRYNIRYL